MRSFVVFVMLVVLAMGDGKQLCIYNWSEYLPKSIVDDFTKETGIVVEYDTYDSNEEMYKNVTSNPLQPYDIVVPSTYLVDRMIDEGLLQKIDKTKLTRYGNLDTKLLSHPFDPQNDYSIPYLWGSTGISYNPALVNEPITSWSNLWNKEYKGSVLLNDDMREVFGVALKLLGYSANSTNPKEIQAAYEKLVELKPNIKMFYSGSQTQIYLNEHVKLGMSFNGESFMTQEKNTENQLSQMVMNPDSILGTKEEQKEIRYIYPKEGVLVWMDSLVIPQKAKNVENAHLFIDYLLRPEVAKLITRDIGYASPNLKAIELLDKSTQMNPVVYPTQKELVDSELLMDVGEALGIYETYWKMLKRDD
ncbi:MAG: spermidine/putrescine ABC transporter substrate-binding protein [Sulfurovum sp. FS08-3]|nr:MAG: spermidine/putrescine ABC transporter substrate-binding protein [Sulfurovum sp. FS08-3]